jgi:iron only hydrogenase large subunit-like protein
VLTCPGFSKIKYFSFHFFSAKHQLTPQETAEKLAHFLAGLGADLILDIQVGEQLAIIEQRKEFMEKFENKRSAAATGGKAAGGPILTSSCPGWICYAEKTHGSWILPFISRSDNSLLNRLILVNYLWCDCADNR